MTAELHPTDETPPPLACPCQGQAMALVRVNPRLGALPELRTYRCGQCGAVETVEVKQPVWVAK
jgi:hypothetical protein